MQTGILSLEQFNEMLRQWSGRRIKVTKHEMNDLDEALINLNQVSYAKQQSLDGYIPRYALHLNGPGMIETLYEFDGSRFILSTSRGVYTLELEDQAAYSYGNLDVDAYHGPEG